ncbi:MAG: amidohydrolase [Proteobacteria bacterium]|nr:amidohydrolase [Pseudomonadota bacterium]HQR03032.1 amidohydrolase family protein [Rhodocyclaceae bacterium]
MPLERLLSVDAHVNFTKEFVYSHASSALQTLWDEASAKWSAEQERKREGQPQLQLEDFIDLEACRDPGWSEPAARLKAMDRDGVFAEVLFPDFGAVLPAVDPRFMGDKWKEAAQVYNSAMATFAETNPSRLLSAYQLPLWDPDLCVSEVERLAKRGAKCVQSHSFPIEVGLPYYHDKRYDKVWAACQETGLVVLNHLSVAESLHPVYVNDPTPQKGIFTSLPSMRLAETMAFWILTGTLEKFPKLNVLMVEPGLGWVPWYLELLDTRMDQHYQFPGVKMLPSEYFKRQMGITFMYEPYGLKVAYEKLGADNLLWSTDFPHPATSWPNSRAGLPKQFALAGVPERDWDKITRSNAERVFHI